MIVDRCRSPEPLQPSLTDWANGQYTSEFALDMTRGCSKNYGYRGAAQFENSLQQAAVPPLAGFPVRNFNRSIIRSLTPQPAAGNALAVAVQGLI